MSEGILTNIKNLTRNIIKLDNEIKELSNKIQYTRKIKTTVEKKLINNMKQGKISNKAITYQNKKVLIYEDKSYDILSFKFLEECFLKLYHKDTKKVEYIINFIKNQRKKKINECIKIK